MESEGSSWYNGLETSLTKRLSQGFQFLASYTYSKTLDTDGSDVDAIAASNGRPLGDQNSPRQRWGRTSFDRTHAICFWRNMEPPQPVSPAPTHASRRVGLASVVYDSIWQRSHHLVHQCQQRFRNKHRPGTTQWHLLEKTNWSSKDRCNRN